MQTLSAHEIDAVAGAGPTNCFPPIFPCIWQPEPTVCPVYDPRFDDRLA